MSRRAETETCPEYEALPISVKALYSYKEWSWLSRSEKDQLVTRETEPEVE